MSNDKPYVDPKQTEPVNRSAIRQAAARGWCHPANSGKVMDSDLAEAIVDEVCAINATQEQK